MEPPESSECTWWGGDVGGVRQGRGLGRGGDGLLLLLVSLTQLAQHG